MRLTMSRIISNGDQVVSSDTIAAKVFLTVNFSMRLLLLNVMFLSGSSLRNNSSDLLI